MSHRRRHARTGVHDAEAGVLDPAGKAVEGSLHALGFAQVSGVRLGKYIELQVEDGDGCRGPRAGGGDVPEAPRQHGGGELPGGDRMKFGIVVFPGSNCDHDAYHVVEHVLGQQAQLLWHKDRDLKGSDAGHPPRRLHLRRLPALRGHRALLAGDGGGGRLRRARAGRSRHLQRLPDPHRGGAAARRAAAATRTRKFICQDVELRGRERADRRSPRARRGRECCACRSPTARATTSSTTRG